MQISRIVVANRGEIAARIIRTCKSMGVETVLAVSEADRDSLPARMADRTVCIGPASADRSYLNVKALVATALGTGADAIHPGYGFLAEEPELADACAEHEVIFIGPRPDQIRAMGNKLEALAVARRCGVPVLPGSELVRSVDMAVSVAGEVGYPVMLKAAAGGGGRGMKVVTGNDAMAQLFVSAAAEARAAFGDDSLYVEKYISNARHVEVQVLGDSHGQIVHLGERDCSLQRRHQKLVEESPAPRISESIRRELHHAAIALARTVHYESAGTVEFILDQSTQKFYFLEMNTRIQVEHPVTEMVTGLDIVAEQLRIASGERLRITQDDVAIHGHALECRVTAEIPEENFRPNPGTIEVWEIPVDADVRVDTHCYAGYKIPIHYDSLLAKIIVRGKSRMDAIIRMRDVLTKARINGVRTTVDFLRTVMSNARFADGTMNTRLIEELIEDTRSR